MATESRINLILNQLNNRMDMIKTARNRVPSSYNGVDKTVINFRSNISYFIHFVISTPELKDVFDRLLCYRENTKNNKEFTDLVARASNSLQKLGKYIIELPGFEQKCLDIDDKSGKWNNVFRNEELMPYATTKEFIQIMSEGPDVNKLTISQLEVLSKILVDPQELLSIYTCWASKTELDIPEFWETIKTITELIQELDYIERYQFQYLNADAAEALLKIYLITNPKYSNNLSTDLSLLKYVTDAGSYRLDVDEEMFFCEKLHSYLMHSLSVGVAKKTVIKRFKTYMEVFRAKDYKSDDVIGEKAFQHEFEEFIFYQGYLPVSEATLGNGRLDTLSISSDEAFLCELKQIGFGKTQETKSAVEEKIEFGMHEPTIYQGRLADYPNLLPEVHVVIFAKVPIRLTEDYVYINALHYYFYVIDLSSVSPSKQSKVIVVDPLEQFHSNNS